MKLLLGVVGYISLWMTFTLAVPIHDQLLQRAVPLAPSEDPFYVPPTGLEDCQPGSILRNRSIGPLSIGGAVPFRAKAAYQLLYRTTDSLGKASAAVTTIIVPDNANTSRLLSYQFATDSPWVNCAPSYTIQLGSDLNNEGSNGAETFLVIAALNQGWIVNLPDYESLQAVFTSGIQAGQATLDSVRASLSSGSLTSISPQAEYQMWGYSGGALASGWAAELQPSYAPELNFKGVALGGLVPNVTSVLLTVNKSLFAGLIPAGIIGLTNGYPKLKEYVDQNLIQSKASEFYKASTQCLFNVVKTYRDQDMFSYFKDGKASVQSDVAQEVLGATGQMGIYGTPNMPMFVYKAVNDQVSVIADTDALVNKFCSQGANIEYVRDGLGEHTSELITGAGDAFIFLIKRFNGLRVTRGCSIKTVLTDTLDPGAIAVFGRAISNGLLALLQVPVGTSNIFGLSGTFSTARAVSGAISGVFTKAISAVIPKFGSSSWI
ncbi:hypothetical protein NHQ30_002395 [Ciborinia camelliae]|nr:hypothetical protein NHQ30_002395 [Ciborinia camelliae]